MAECVAGSDVPRQVEREEDEGGGDEMPVQHPADPAGCEQIEDSDDDGKDEAGESLREDTEGAAASEGEGAFEMTFFPGVGTPEEIEGEGGPKAEEDVGQEEMAEEEDAAGGEQTKRGVEGRGGRVEDPAAEGEGGDDDAEDGDGDREARGPAGDVEEAEADSDGPVEEGRMVRIADAVGEGGEPVARGEHLAGDLGAESIGAVEERGLDEGKRSVEEHPEAEQGKDEALGRAQGGHPLQGTGCSRKLEAGRSQRGGWEPGAVRDGLSASGWVLHRSWCTPSAATRRTHGRWRLRPG